LLFFCHPKKRKKGGGSEEGRGKGEDVVDAKLI